MVYVCLHKKHRSGRSDGSSWRAYSRLSFRILSRSHWLMFYQERYVNMQDKSIATAYASDEGTEGRLFRCALIMVCAWHILRGEGYSGGFTAHMAEMLKLFLSGKRIRLHVDTDEICSACPNNQDGICEARGQSCGVRQCRSGKMWIESRAGAGFCCIYKNSPGKDSCDG